MNYFHFKSSDDQTNILTLKRLIHGDASALVLIKKQDYEYSYMFSLLQMQK